MRSRDHGVVEGEQVHAGKVIVSPDVAKSRVQVWRHQIAFFVLIKVMRQSECFAETSCVHVINAHVRPNLRQIG